MVTLQGTYLLLVLFAITRIKSIWSYASNVGIHSYEGISSQEKKRLQFFNQLLFIGVWATILQVFITWPFIGYKALYFLVVTFATVFSFYLNGKGYFGISKRVFLLSVYLVGLYTTILIGGDGLYHVGVFSTFAASLIIFDIRKEYREILLGVPIVILIIFIGEFDWFDTPDFSQHPLVNWMKFTNLFSLIAVNSILTVFIIQLNNQAEDKLSATMKELSESKDHLEELVDARSSEIRKQRDVLLNQNREKEELLKEIHHRVKNNLQIIVSLINLQQMKLKEKEVEIALDEIKSQVMAMSMVHQRMYQAVDFASVDFKDYVREIATNIKLTHPDKKATFELSIPESSKLDVETAIPVGLILNEVVMNFYKHGRMKGDNSVLGVKVKKKGEGFQVECTDNGAGFNSESVLEQEGNTGLQLIDSLVDQIDGEFEVYNNDGACYQFTIRA